MADSSGIIDPIVQQIVDTIRVSDTMFVSIIDTVQMAQSTSNFDYSSWAIVFIALVSLLVSIIIFLHSKKLQDRLSINEINEGWVKLTDSRIIFWDKIDTCFELWKKRLSAPLSNLRQQSIEDIGDLVELAGIPANLDEIGNREGANSFLKKIESTTTNESQKIIIQFFRNVYPPKGQGDSILRYFGESSGKANLETFNKSRINLSLAYNNWAATSDMQYLRNRFSDDYCLIASLSWLELILVESLGNKWSSRTNLFKLACEIQKEKDKKK